MNLNDTRKGWESDLPQAMRANDAPQAMRANDAPRAMQATRG